MVIGTPTPLEEIFIYTVVCKGDLGCAAVVILLLLAATVVVMCELKRRK